MLFKFILAVHIVVCLALIIVVLLQSSKGGGLAGAFGGGGGGGQTMFGGQETATFLSRTTTYLAILFMVLSLVLALLSGRQGNSVRSVVREAAEQQRNVIPSATGQSIDNILGGAADTSGTGAATIDTSGGQ